MLGREFQALQERLAQEESGLIEPYAATNAAEFFAVVSELFFEKPTQLALAHRALFAEFCGYYGVNPLHWIGSTATVSDSESSR